MMACKELTATLLILGLAITVSAQGLVGGPEPVSDVSEFKLDLLNCLSKTNSPNLKLVSIEKCTKQVVAGIKISCDVIVESPESRKPCSISYVKQAWISDEPTNVQESCSGSASRRKRELCAGCPTDADVNSNKIISIMSSALSQTNSGTELLNVKECTQQVVAGIKYNCKVEVKSPNTNGAKTCVISVITQPWISKEPKVLSETCSVPAKTKRSLVGGLIDVDEKEKVLVQELASFAVKTLDDIDSDNSKRVVANVLKAQKQLVNGIMYFLKLHVRTTSCEENSETNDKCLSTDSGPQKICDIQVYRSFADESPLNAKVTKAECNPVDKIVSLGGYQPVQTNGEEIHEIAEFAAKRASNMVNSPFLKKLSSIEKAFTQIVDGINYKMTLILTDTECMKSHVAENSVCKFSTKSPSSVVCDVVVHVKPWEKLKKISELNCKDIPHVTVSRVKRSGDSEPLDVDSPMVLDLVPFISARATASSNSGSTPKMVKVLNASQRIVSGRIINLQVLINDEKCSDSSNTDGLNCKESQICDVSIWEQPWVHERKITEFSCKSALDTAEEDAWLESLAQILGVDSEDEHFHQFSTFLANYDKKYSNPEEYKLRFKIFRANMKKVKYLQKTEQGTGVYGATQFSDLSSSEFKKNYLGFKLPKNSIESFKVTAETPNITVPQSFDWRDYNAVTPVKNQGQCGSCWAFSVTGNIEGQYAIQNKKLLSLSEQELVDCDKYDEGCNGGLFDTAYHALEDLGGLETESQYPYNARKNQCHFQKSKVKVSITGSVNISQNEVEMAKWLTVHGPISVALNANAMQFYMGGVSHPLKFLCSPKQLDHGVLIVGYGVHSYPLFKKVLPFWIVKNSWGENWGIQGYYWLYRGDGACGINQMPTSAVL